MEPVLHQYLWLVVVGAFGAFGFGWGTGANDVANAFGTSVGAKTLTLRQAVLIAAVFEFTGALVLGRVSTSVIAGKIANPETFIRQPEMYAYGMSCTLAVGTVWLAIASFYGYNVSSTHTIIGGIIGFALVHGGTDSVNWATKDPSGKSFPPYTGVLPIVLSWFVSPVLTALGASLVFLVVRTLVLRSSHAHQRAYWVLPPFVFLTVFINLFFVFTKGAAKTLAEKNGSWTKNTSLWVSAVTGLGVACLAAAIVIPILRRRTTRHFEEQEEMAKGKPEAAFVEEGRGGQAPQETDLGPHCNGFLSKSLSRTWKAINHGMTVDIHEVVETDPVIAALHERAEKFDPRVEHVFGYLQVFSAMCVILAHGAGEVGYMAGPLGAIWDIYNNGYLPKSVIPPIWVILVGAIGLVVGLATYGYNVTRAMGTMMAKLSPSRGFAAELATSMVIMVAAQYGLPTSSSQCITGGIVGVGLMEGIVGVNWGFFARQFASWVATLIVVGLLTAAVYAQGVYAPSEIDGGQVKVYEDSLVAISGTMYRNFNKTLFDYRSAAQAGMVPPLTDKVWAELNASLSKKAQANHRLNDTKAKSNSMTVDPAVAVGYLKQALTLVQDHSILTLGQVTTRAGAQICNNNITGDISRNISAPCPSPRLV